VHVKLPIGKSQINSGLGKDLLQNPSFFDHSRRRSEKAFNILIQFHDKNYQELGV